MDLPPIVALEVGTTNIRALIAKVRDDGHLMIIGLGECASRGIRKSEIVDFENALSCVKTALHRAENNADVAIRQVYLLLSGGHIQSVVNAGSTPIGNGGEITRDDIEHVMEVARTINLPPDREVLHTICQHFQVDEQGEIINPLGMEGSRLSLNMLIIHGIRNRMRNLIRLATTAGVEVQDVVFGGLCAALAVLSPEQKENGVAVIDLGGGKTDYLAYAGSTIAAAGTLAIGGDHVTNDIAYGLRIPNVQAERLKEQSGSARIDVASRTQRVELPNETGPAGRFVRLGDLQTITSLRIEEILNKVKLRLDGQGLLPYLGSGIVLTGGGAYLKDIADVAQKIFGMPCQVGRPRDVAGLQVAVNGPEYSAPVGMLRYALKAERREAKQGSLIDRLKELLNWS